MIAPRHVVYASFAVWLVCVLLQWLANPPLGHDEAAYALLARDGQDKWLYRPIGTIALARIGIALGGDELALRVPSSLFGLMLIPAVAMLGRRFGTWTGAWAAALVATSHTFVMRGFQLLNDVPAAACVFIAIAIAIDELDRPEGPRDRLVLVAPCCAAAVYLRYGSVLAIAVVAVTALVLWRSWLRRARAVLLTLGAFALLIAPLLVYSHAKTGSPLGVFELARKASTYPLGQGFDRFALANPLTTFGVLVAPVMIAGLASALGTLDARARLLAISALAMSAWLGLFSDGSARLLFAPIVFLVLLGVRAFAASHHARALARVGGAFVVAAWVAMVALAVPIQRHIESNLGVMTVASSSIRTHAAGRPCVVFAYWLPQLMWYSGCVGKRALRWDTLRLPDAVRAYAAAMPGHPVQPAEIVRSLALRPTPLPGAAAWYLPDD